MWIASEQRVHEEAPLYVRWNPERTPFAIEMKLELVARMGAEIANGNRLNFETGGVLVGSFPSSAVPTLRIDDFIPVPRRADDGQVFMLNPAEHERFAQVRWLGVSREKTAVGFFRSHLRPGPLKPSIADRGLLSEHFREVYVLLLVEGREPNRAAFFIAANRELPDQPSVREFRFDEAEFKSLPEMQPEEAREQEPATEGRRLAWRPWWAVLFAFVLLACAALVWSTHGSGGAGPFGNPAAINLSIAGTGPVVKISWNHAAREIAHASGATLTVVDGGSRREIALGEDDLMLGAIDYKRSTGHVEAALTLKVPGGSATQTANWQAQR
jgi:hypothetical protein